MTGSVAIPKTFASRTRVFGAAQHTSPSALSAWVDETTTFGTAGCPEHGTELMPPSPSAKGELLSQRPHANLSVSTGKPSKDVPRRLTTTGIAVRAADPLPMAPRNALELRRHRIECIYPADAWEALLKNANLLEKYPFLVHGFRAGFFFDFPSISSTQTPPNRPSVIEFATEFGNIVSLELQKGRYIGPFSKSDLESLIGPFQTSPFSIIPKPGRPGKFRIIQNFSFPLSPSPVFPNASINSFTNAKDFPCTWGSFAVVALLLGRLPPGSQIAVRDVSEAFRTVPLHPSQWAACAVRVGDDSFCVDTCGAFGACPSGGVFGLIQDATVDLFRSHGIGPVTKWVDDHLFARILRRYLEEYNAQRALAAARFASRGPQYSGGRVFYGGDIFPDGSTEESDDDCRFPMRDLSSTSPRSADDGEFCYNFEDIDRFSSAMGTPWEVAKDCVFSSSASFTGYVWCLESRMVSIGLEKREKYLVSIAAWRTSARHSLEEVQKLYGRLLHCTNVCPAGRAYLTCFETLLGQFSTSDRPLALRHSPRGLSSDLEWWERTLSRPMFARPIPIPVNLLDIGAFSDASSGVGIAIVVGNRWRAWRLITGWQTLNGAKDIGWAEAVGFELLIYTICTLDSSNRCFKLYGDNIGVVEGWWNRRSRNSAVNSVFKRIHSFLDGCDRAESIFTAYVPTDHNPADKPSRGIYPALSLLLPPCSLPRALHGLVIDYDAVPSSSSLPASSSSPCGAGKPRLQREDRAARQSFNKERFLDDLASFTPDWDDCAR